MLAKRIHYMVEFVCEVVGEGFIGMLIPKTGKF